MPVKINVYVITHAGLADAFAEATQMIMGPQPQLRTIGFYAGDDLMETADRLVAMIQNNPADFHVVFTDLFGATPSHIGLLAISQCENAAVITGVNLIAVMEALGMDGEDVDRQPALQRIEGACKQGVRALTKDMIS